MTQTHRCARGPMTLPALVAALAVAVLSGCATVDPSPSAIHSTPSAASGSETASLTPGPFICANPPGVSARYAYVAADRQLRIVQSCGSSMTIRSRSSRTLIPQAFSTSGKWLLANEVSWDPQPPAGKLLCAALIDPVTGATTITSLCNPATYDASLGWYGFIGWADDNTFYESHQGAGSDTSVEIVRISLPGLTSSPVTRFPWVANLANTATPSGIALRHGALYYAGYASATDHAHAWLHRFILSPGIDTPIVSLGIASNGGCQVQADNTPCTWAGSWAISPDGGRITYHIPGPTESPSDTPPVEASPPLYVAASDGAGATRLFSGVPTGGFNSATFSPDGRYVVSVSSTQWDQPITLFAQRLSDGAILAQQKWMAPVGWTPDSTTIVVMQFVPTGDTLEHEALYNVETHALIPLQPGSSQYVWSPVV